MVLAGLGSGSKVVGGPRGFGSGGAIEFRMLVGEGG